MGYYPESKQRNSEIPPSFITVNIMYIDLLKSMTGLTSILNEKYCDCDGTFGLHDYGITIDVRNQKQSFFCEIFRKVFTQQASLDKNFISSPYKKGSNKLSKPG